MVQTKKRNIFELIGEGFKGVFANPRVILPALFSLILSLILVLLGIFVFLKILGVPFTQLFSETIDTATSTQIVNDMLANLETPGTIVLLIVMAVLFLLVFLIVTSYFNGGIIGMMKEFYEKNKKTGLSEMNKYGMKFLGRIFLFNILFNIIFFILAVILSLPSVAIDPILKTALSIYSIFEVIILFIFYLFFSLTSYSMILEDSNVWKAMKRSFSIVGHNFFSMLFLMLLFLIMSVLVLFIPYVGWIISAILITIAMTITFLLFAKERKQ
ncbi:MAG: hypothetical protein NTX24_04670 [Candidatus Pacearchaeota archaeon]|nr:hypothetical protein [Candidatus Pacearchaeota archaeon]